MNIADVNAGDVEAIGFLYLRLNLNSEGYQNDRARFGPRLIRRRMVAPVDGMLILFWLINRWEVSNVEARYS